MSFDSVAKRDVLRSSSASAEEAELAASALSSELAELAASEESELPEFEASAELSTDPVFELDELFSVVSSIEEPVDDSLAAPDAALSDVPSVALLVVSVLAEFEETILASSKEASSVDVAYAVTDGPTKTLESVMEILVANVTVLRTILCRLPDFLLPLTMLRKSSLLRYFPIMLFPPPIASHICLSRPS